MPDDTPGESEELNFERAEVEEAPDRTLCAACEEEIRESYYQAGTGVVCHGCAGELHEACEGGSPGPRLARAVYFGVGAGIVAALLWYFVREITGYEIGLIAIAVGFIVGIGVRKGCGGRGGLVYQFLAVGLTYISIAGCNVPYILDYIREDQRQFEAEENAAAAGEMSAGETPRMITEPQPEPTLVELGTAWAFVIFVALTAPFYAGDLIGLLIIGIALYEAWRLNVRQHLEITGPFKIGGTQDLPPAEPA